MWTQPFKFLRRKMRRHVARVPCTRTLKWAPSACVYTVFFNSGANHCFCGCDWRHMIAVAMNITTKRLIIHEAESTHKYHHKHPLEIRSTRKKNWNKRLTKHLGNLKKTLVKLQVISRWPRARQCRGPVRMLLINKGVSPLVKIPAVTVSNSLLSSSFKIASVTGQKGETMY